jgi:hypothetical protein
MFLDRRTLLAALGVWSLLLGFAFVNALFRRTVLEPNLGPEPAHFLATTTLAGATLVAALLWIGTSPRDYSLRELLRVGLLWFCLTVVFDFTFGRFVLGRSSRELLADYDPSRGRLFLLVLLTELIGPAIAGLGRRTARKGEGGAR